MLEPEKLIETPLDVSTEISKGTATLRLTGELDLAGQETFQNGLGKIESQPLRELFVDLRGLTFIDSSGLRMLITTLRDSRERGLDLAFIKPEGQVREVLEATRLMDELPLVDAPNET